MRQARGIVAVLRGTILTALILVSVSCTDSDSPVRGRETRTTGRLVIAGGAVRPENAAIYQAVIDGQEGNGALCVIPTASSDPAASMERAVEILTNYAGTGSVKGILISTEDPSQAQDSSIVAEMETCSGFFFTGGSQSRILDVFLPSEGATAAYQALWQRWQEGAVVSGSSAGAAMMSRVMISGGSSSEAVTYGVQVPGGEGVSISEGMGFFEVGTLDQHFLARGRIGRTLVSVLNQNTPKIGFGIDENTALVVDGDSAWVVGASGVVVVDGRSVKRTGSHRGSNLLVNLIGMGDVLDLKTLAVQRESAKIPVPITSTSVESTDDPFARWAFLHLMAALSSSSATEATYSLSEASLRIAEDEGFSASMMRITGGVEGTPLGLSAGPFRVDILDRSTEN